MQGERKRNAEREREGEREKWRERVKRQIFAAISKLLSFTLLKDEREREKVTER
jgi:hypothetical protein